MEIEQLYGTVRDTLTVRRVFGEPYERDGVTVIPAARITGGAGGGTGEGSEGEGRSGSGSGSGIGLSATPAGAYVIRDGTVSWQPALDLNRVILGAQVVAVIALLTLRKILTRRRRRRR
jgi:uncharacterized spore protein YtfJ